MHPRTSRYLQLPGPAVLPEARLHDLWPVGGLSSRPHPLFFAKARSSCASDPLRKVAHICGPSFSRALSQITHDLTPFLSRLNDPRSDAQICCRVGSGRTRSNFFVGRTAACSLARCFTGTRLASISRSAPRWD